MLPDVLARGGVLGLPILDKSDLSYACDESCRLRLSSGRSPWSLSSLGGGQLTVQRMC